MTWATPPFVPTGIQPENNVSSLKLNPEDGPKTYMGPYPVAEHYVVDFPITEEVISISLPETYFTADPPFVLAMINGGVTELTVAGVIEEIEKLGNVYTKVQFTFPASAIGKRCHAWLAGGF